MRKSKAVRCAGEAHTLHFARNVQIFKFNEHISESHACRRVCVCMSKNVRLSNGLSSCVHPNTPAWVGVTAVARCCRTIFVIITATTITTTLKESFSDWCSRATTCSWRSIKTNVMRVTWKHLGVYIWVWWRA